MCKGLFFIEKEPVFVAFTTFYVGYRGWGWGCTHCSLWRLRHWKIKQVFKKHPFLSRGTVQSDQITHFHEKSGLGGFLIPNVFKSKRVGIEHESNANRKWIKHKSNIIDWDRMQLNKILFDFEICLRYGWSNQLYFFLFYNYVDLLFHAK